MNPRLLALSSALSAFIAISLIANFYPVPDDYRPLNTGWNGASTLLSSQNFRVIEKMELPGKGSGALLMVVGPRVDFSVAEIDRMKDFLRAGGTVLLADDFGTGNEFLRGVGSAVSFSNLPLLDPLVYSRGPTFPLITDMVDEALTMNVTEFVLNRPTSLIIKGDGVEVLARSSLFSFLDEDMNGREDGEPRGPFPIMAMERVGEGRLIVLSDPSMFINGMALRANNSVLVSNILRAYQEIYFDGSHWERSRLADLKEAIAYPVNSILYGVRDQGLVLGYGLLLLLALSLAAGLRSKPRLERKGGEVKKGLERPEDVLARHGGWNRRTLEYLYRELVKPGRRRGP